MLKGFEKYSAADAWGTLVAHKRLVVLSKDPAFVCAAAAIADKTADQTGVAESLESETAPPTLCQFFATERGCNRGTKCKFLHGASPACAPLPPPEIVRTALQPVRKFCQSHFS